LSVFITAASSRSGPLPVDGGLIRVPAGNRSLELHFAATTFISESSVQFRYRLLDGGEGWIETSQRTVSLNLNGAGSRTFQVQARRPGEAWSGAAEASIDVAATWYESWWFRLLVAAAAAGLFYSGWRWWLKLHMRRERELERLVAERTREVERLLVKAHEAGLLKDEFLANISHEIRTPMNAVLGMTSLALETSLDDEQRDYLQTVESSARELLQLLNEVLDFSKIESGKLAIDVASYEPGALIESACRTMEPLALAKKLELRARLDPELPAALIGDPAKLRQVLLNLLSNAIKFTERGSIGCSAALVRSAAGDRVRYSVADTGIGIAADKRDLIFEPFRQADGSTTRRYGGTGLGLSISKRLVEMMGGEIELHSEPGRGSEFTFELPLPVPAEAPLPAPDPMAATSAYELAELNNRVLLVEDNEVGRRLAVLLLEKIGCQVVAAAGGAEAVELVKRNLFDMILLDLQMPGMGGIEAMKEIRAIESALGRHTPVIILSANTRAAERQRAIEAGADGYLTKPISMADLYRALAGGRQELDSMNK
jgi:signal transduction histidine kinase/ActR/RegA family two-component response regulator